MAQRPIANGSSDVITEILVGLTVLGASALAVVAALGAKPASAPAREQPQSSDEGGSDA